MNLSELCRIAITAARSAGKVIQESKSDVHKVEKKNTGTSYASQVLTEVDIACEKIILSYLLPTCKEYDIALLSEETEDNGTRFLKDYFWCIDPMDGTLSFINDHPGFSVSIALLAKDGTPHLGVVFDPSTNTMYHALKGIGAFKNDKPWIIKNTNDYLTYVTDRKLEETPRVDEIKSLLDEKAKILSLKRMKEISGGGAVLNAIHVLENGPACMLKLPKKEKGGGSIWDFAATACLFEELGMHASDFEGRKLKLNRKDGTFMNNEGVLFSNWAATINR